MDTKYKLADHHPMDKSLIQTAGMWHKWGKDDVRSYVGKRGWTISRHETENSWKISHKSYPDLTLTMLDKDALPVGRHDWRINNNVCNQGSTNVQSLLISGCKEEEFTCDDGKCLDITKRCNNIEVMISMIIYCCFGVFCLFFLIQKDIFIPLIKKKFVLPGSKKVHFKNLSQLSS